MSDIQNVGPTNQPSDGIEDAEFIEVRDEPTRFSSPPRPPYEYKWKPEVAWIRMTAVTLPLLMLGMCVAFMQPVAVATDANVVSVDQNPRAVVKGTVITPVPAGVGSETGDRIVATVIPAPNIFRLPRMRRGEPYAGVRRRLIMNGFTPAHYNRRDCSPWETSAGHECYNRPEVAECAGTGMAPCNTYWLRGDRALWIVTLDGPDGTFDRVTAMTRNELITTLARDGQSLVTQRGGE